MKNLFLILSLAICWFNGSAQVKWNGRVFSEDKNEPLAFVTVLETGTQNGVFTDIDGYFSINVSGTEATLTLTYVGYLSQKITWTGSETGVIRLRSAATEMKEVKVVAGINPAEIIMQKAIDRRDKNNPEKSSAFIYDSYNKFVITAEEDSVKVSDALVEDKSDTNAVEMKAFFNARHLFLTENITKRKHLPPAKDEEVVIANRVSGFKSAPFTLLGTQIQSFSVYTDMIRVLDIAYLSPLANAAISKYFFILEDTTLIGNDTVYSISFRPRKGKNFKGLTGTLSINTDGWAVQHFIASPANEEEGIHIRIQQQYTKKGGAWFPEQLNSFLHFPSLSVNGMKMMGVGRSYIRNLEVNPSLRSREFGPVVLRMDPKAGNVPDSLWNVYREHPLEVKEQSTYTFLDSLGEAENFEKKLKLINILATGKFPVGIINIDLDRIVGLNEFEGFRLGAGIHTNDFLSRRFSIGGYYAYGFKDRGHKYGGDLLIHLQRKRNTYIQFLYSEDVKEAGGNQQDVRRTTFITNTFYPLLISHMDQIEKWEARFNGRVAGNLTTTAFVNRQNIRMYEGNIFIIPRLEDTRVLIRDFQVQEAGIQLRWAPGERLAETGEREVSLGSKWPVWYFRYIAGLTDNLSISDRYNRYDVLVDKTFRTPLWGDLSIRLHGGWIPGDLPLSLYYNARGTNTINYDKNRYIGIASPYNFETMQTNEFLHNRYIAVHIRHSFRDLLVKSKAFNPLFTLVHNMIWGDLENPGFHSRPARQAEEGYFESGLCIDNLLKNGFSGFGIGMFYRYGPYSFSEAKENLIFKISTSIVF